MAPNFTNHNQFKKEIREFVAKKYGYRTIKQINPDRLFLKIQFVFLNHTKKYK